MELLVDRDPEHARKLLDPVVERMMEAVHRYEGTVNQVMGEGIMALFGAPIAHEDHAVRACAGRAVTLAHRRGERGHEAWGLRLLGEIASHHASPEVAAAAAHYAAAMTRASELDMRPLAAHCHAGLGRLYERPGGREQAREHLTTARAMYGEMGMTHWLERLEKGDDLPHKLECPARDEDYGRREA